MNRSDGSEATPLFRSLWQLVTLAAVLAIGIGLRVYGLSEESLWYDEAVSVDALDEPSLGAFLDAERAYDPAMMPLFFVTEYYVAKATGTSLVLLRCISVAMGIGAMIVLYAFGRSLFGHGGGLVATLTLALSKNHIFYSQDIRMYAMYYFFALLSLYFLYLAIHRRQHWAWGACMLANAAVLATHLFGTTVLLVELVYVFYLYGFRRVPPYAWTLANSALLVPFGWWISSISMPGVQALIGWIPKPTTDVLLGAYFHVFTGAKLISNEPLRHLVYPGSAILGVIFVLLAIRLFRVARGRIESKLTEPLDSRTERIVIERNRSAWYALTAGRGFDRNVFVLLLLWFFLPPIALYVLSYTIRPCFVERYVLQASFGIFLLAGGAVVSYRRALAQSIMLAALALASAYILQDLKRPIRPDWQGVAKHIQQDYVQGEFVRVPEGYDREYALPMRLHAPDLPLVGRTGDFAGEAIELATYGNTVWVPVIVEPPLSPKLFQFELDRQKIPYTIQVFGGRKQIALFKLNEEKRYIVENINLEHGNQPAGGTS